MDDRDDLPEALRAELEALVRPPAVPDDRDAAIRARLDEAFEAARPPRTSRLRLLKRVWLPAAVAALVLFWLRPRGVAGDVDGSGTLDVLDAYAVALRARSGAGGEPWDIDEDGSVTEADARVLLARIVSLDGGPG